MYRGKVRPQRDLSESIRDAIEASYYVSPEAPGLTSEELATVLAEFGFQAGEINDVLRSPRSGLGGTPAELRLGRIPHALAWHQADVLMRHARAQHGEAGGAGMEELGNFDDDIIACRPRSTADDGASCSNGHPSDRYLSTDVDRCC